MKIDPVESRRAWFWLLGAGAFGVALTIGLARIDDFLSNSRHEQALEASLRSLRTAQASQEGRVTDQRQFVPLIRDR